MGLEDVGKVHLVQVRHPWAGSFEHDNVPLGSVK
jgi:hypothetical protein